MRMLMAEQRDIRMMTVYGYARLVGYDEKLELAARYPAELRRTTKNRVFTLHLRPGHKWSDGQPFTAGGFPLSTGKTSCTTRTMDRGGLASALLMPAASRPKFEVIDELTVRYTWDEPNPALPAGARRRAAARYLQRLAHYLKQFHAKYADPEKLAAAVARRTGQELDAAADPQGRAATASRIPDLPTLEPWTNMTNPPAEPFVFERNPYFHRVDQNGRAAALCRPSRDQHRRKLDHPGQDRRRRERPAGALSRLRRLHLPEGGREAQQLHRAGCGRSARGRAVALFPNLNTNDAGWRELFRDARFRRALSLGIDRREINQVLFAGLAKEGANTVLPRQPALPRRTAAPPMPSSIPSKANALLDEIGLKRGDERHAADAGRPAARPDRRKRPARARWKPTCWNWSTGNWAQARHQAFDRAPAQRDIFRSRVACRRNQ